jgi:nucleotide-binding universal stress UspA family protein
MSTTFPSPTTKPAPETASALPPLRYKTILVPTDFSEFSRAAIEYAQRLAEQVGGTLVLLHVVEPVYPYAADGPLYFPGDLRNPNFKPSPDAEKAIARLAENVAGTAGRPVEGKVSVGQAYDEIARMARELPADLIVIASHGYTGLKHVFMGSTAERVVRHATCPVLVVRQPAETAGA